MQYECTSRYRALERIDTEELALGFEDDEQEPLEFPTRTSTFYDDKFWICYEETDKARLKDLLKDKKR